MLSPLQSLAPVWPWRREGSSSESEEDPKPPKGGRNAWAPEGSSGGSPPSEGPCEMAPPSNATRPAFWCSWTRSVRCKRQRAWPISRETTYEDGFKRLSYTKVGSRKGIDSQLRRAIHRLGRSLQGSKMSVGVAEVKCVGSKRRAMRRKALENAVPHTSKCA